MNKNENIGEHGSLPKEIVKDALKNIWIIFASIDIGFF